MVLEYSAVLELDMNNLAGDCYFVNSYLVILKFLSCDTEKLNWSDDKLSFCHNGKFIRDLFGVLSVVSLINDLFVNSSFEN